MTTTTPTTDASARVRMRKHERRSQILDEAIRIIGEQGFRSFSLQELAKRCGLTNAGLLHHFGSKDGLLVALLRERDRQDEAAVAKSLPRQIEGEPLAREGVLTVLRAIVQQNSCQPELVRMYAMLRAEALVPDHPAHGYFAARERAAIEMFAQILSGHVADPSVTGLHVIAMMNGLEAQWLREDCGFDLVAVWDSAAAKLIE